MGTEKLPVGGSHRVNVGDEGSNWAQNTQVSLTGTTAETELARLLLPGGFIGPNGELDIHLAFTNNNSENDKTIKVTLNGVTLLTHINTTDTFDFGHIYLINRNNVAANLSINADFNIVPAAIDTDEEMVLVVTGTLESGADNMALEIIHAAMTYRS